MTTYYVSTTGNDNNPGTITVPFLTIQKGADVSNPGDTIIVQSGTYIEEINITKSGSPDNPITFKANGNVVIKAPNKAYHSWKTVTPQHHSGNIEIIGKSYITIKGFIFKGYRAEGITSVQNPQTVISVEQNSHHIVIDGNQFINIDAYGIVFGGYFIGAHYIDFINNYIDYSYYYDTAKYVGGYNELISFDKVGFANVSGNTFYKSIGMSIDLKHGSHDSIVSNNKITGGWQFEAWWFNYQSQGIYIDGFEAGVSNIKVFNNLLIDNGLSLGSECGGLTKDVSVFNNIIIGSTMGLNVANWNDPTGMCPGKIPSYQNIQILNNIVYNSIPYTKPDGATQYGYWFWIQKEQADIYLRNNIGFGTGNGNRIPSLVTQDHNTWNLNIIDPMFVNASTYDFHLKSGSLCINAGSNINAPSFDFDNNNRTGIIDIGVFEFGANPCIPNWQCEQPLNGYEKDGCGNRKLNPACCPPSQCNFTITQ